MKNLFKDVYRSNQADKIEDTTSIEEKEMDWNWMKDFKDVPEEAEVEKIEPKKRGRPRKKVKDIDVQKKVEKEIRKPNTRSQKKRKVEFEAKSKVYYVHKPIEDISFIKYINTFEKKQRENFEGFTNRITEEEEEEELRQCLIASLNNDPVSFDEAMKTKERVFWRKAVKEEIDSMIQNEVWNLVDKTKIQSEGKRANIIDSKWVFRKKLEVDGSTRYKARLVIRGFKDKNKYDLKETYAPVSRLPVIRAVLAVINKYDLYACQLDVKTAFLNGSLEEEIYMEIPDGLEVDARTKNSKVCKLKKALYGLKVSPKKWNRRFTEEIRKLDLENDLHEPCLYTWRKDGKMAILVICVDDILAASNDEEKLEEIKKHLGKAFEMKDLGEPKCFLEKFNMKECNPQSTPMVTKRK